MVGLDVRVRCQERGPRGNGRHGLAANDHHPHGAWLCWAVTTIMMMVRGVASLIRVSIHGHSGLARPGKLERSQTSPRRTHRWQPRATSLTAARPSPSTITTMAGAATAGDASWVPIAKSRAKPSAAPARLRVRRPSRTRSRAGPARCSWRAAHGLSAMVRPRRQRPLRAAWA